MPETVFDVALHATVADGQRRFDLDLHWRTPARAVALFGPSGAGKSLSLQAMAGLVQPTAGHVRINGRTLYDHAAGITLPVQQRGIGYLFQQYALFPHLSVRDNVGFGLTGWGQRLGGEAEAAVLTLLQRFGLADLARSKPRHLSGGQQQRVALARALACQPQVLLLDEPFAALNRALKQQLRAELKAVLHEQRLPMVLITHDVADVLALAETAFVIDGGRVLREVPLGSAEQRAAAPLLLHAGDEADGPAELGAHAGAGSR